MLFHADLLWRFSVDLRRIRSVWPENAAELPLWDANDLWRPEAFRRASDGRLSRTGNERAFVASTGSSGGIRSARFIDEDDPLFRDIERARRIDRKLALAGPNAVAVLRRVFAQRMPESRVVFGQHVGLWPDLHGAGNLADDCPAAGAAYKAALARRSLAQRARQPLGLWLDRLGDRLQHKSATAAEVSLGFAVEGFCNGVLAEALRRYEGRPARAA